MRHVVTLRLHEDDNGIIGLCNENAIGKFDAFWGADGIFHDVFEHYMEDAHKYFSGRNAFQIYGEMYASGNAIAYMDLGIDSFRYRYNSNRDYTMDTAAILEDYIYGYSECLDFPLDNCIVPRQSINGSYSSLSTWLNNYHDWYDKHLEKGSLKIKELKMSDVRNCYILGYKAGRKIIGADRDHSYNVLDQFLERWNDITKNEPESLYISDEDAYKIKSFKFEVTYRPKLQVKETIIDEVGNEYPIELLTQIY